MILSIRKEAAGDLRLPPSVLCGICFPGCFTEQTIWSSGLPPGFMLKTYRSMISTSKSSIKCITFRIHTKRLDMIPTKRKRGYDIPSFFKTPKTNTAKILNDTQNSRPSDMICIKIVSDGFLLIILHSLQFIRSGGGFVTWDFSFCNFYVLRQPSEFSLYSQVSAPGYFVVQK